MHYEWDDAKNASNRNKHGVDFALARHFEWDSAIETVDDRRDYGETRYQALSCIDNRVYCLVYTLRNGNVRIISLRKANRREALSYAEARKKYNSTH